MVRKEDETTTEEDAETRDDIAELRSERSRSSNWRDPKTKPMSFTARSIWTYVWFCFYHTVPPFNMHSQILRSEAGVDVGREFFARNDDNQYSTYLVVSTKDIRETSSTWQCRVEVEKRVQSSKLRVIVVVTRRTWMRGCDTAQHHVRTKQQVQDR